MERRSTAYLPDVILTSFSTVPLLVQYRQLLLTTLVRAAGPHAFTTTSPVCEPALGAFLRIADDSHLLEAAKKLFDDQVDRLPRRHRTSSVALRQVFRAVMLHLWPLLHRPDLPCDPTLVLANPALCERRLAVIAAYLRADPAAVTTGRAESAAVGVQYYEPFNIAEVTFQTPLSQSSHNALGAGTAAGVPTLQQSQTLRQSQQLARTKPALASSQGTTLGASFGLGLGRGLGHSSGQF
eukprot:TRINITY_DN5394_c0_g1_i3.p1 TRINITY_DN5394_c0_g1~~TRINITY_DN5394_c0_g1_i3.p1  ORF type:complete len:239 (-),score=48.53 TRINITY_DN5394_c0_g1_i3:116-832(-)